MPLDYEAMLTRILESDFGKAWIRDRKENLKDEVEFYGSPLSERQWKENLVSNFFEESFEVISKVLPELWPEICGIVRDVLDWDVLEKPETFEEFVHQGFGAATVQIPWSLDEYLHGLERELCKVLKARFEPPKEVLEEAARGE